MKIINNNLIKMSGISAKLLEAYIFWQKNNKHIPKMLRYSMGVRIDSLFAEMAELISSAIFIPENERRLVIEKANNKNDTLKFMLYALLELEGIKENIFSDLSLKLEEVGRMLYGWKIKLEKQNQPNINKTMSAGNDKK